ncbi:hypothetical protein [Mastigocladopsis repens]|uniref:hypothetical protein n=1 Tax=Mastigocladopsis repens TaxID=221287 RepID=UPI00030A96CC|nr:hypothetical protein [Mastigocladopsis repens]
MAKKNLSDLLQEEAQKFSPPEGETTIDVVAITDNNPSSPSDNDTGKEEGSAQLEEESKQAADSTTSKRTNPTKAELEATVKELKEALEKAQQKETSLVKDLKETIEKAQQQETSLVKDLKETIEKAQQKEASFQQEVADLQSDLSKQKKLAAKLKTELDDAKQAAVHLAGANSKLTETITTLQQEKEKTQSSQQKKEDNQSSPKSIKSSISNRKSYHLPERQPVNKPEESVDNSSPMWLLD